MGQLHKAMLKSLSRFTTLIKVDNGIIPIQIQQLRKYSSRKMEKGNFTRPNSNQKYFKDNRSNVNEFRNWIQVAPQPKKPGLAFSVLNYNILSQRLLEMHSYLYEGYSRQELSWNKRFYNLVGEILYNNPDILCCQVSVFYNCDISFCLLFL